MTDSEKRLLPVLGVAVLFAVYWFFIRGDDDGGNNRRRPRRPKPTPTANQKTPIPTRTSPKPTSVAKTGPTDAGVPLTRVDAAPPPPPQQWMVVASTEGKVEWVSPRARVLKNDILVKFRGYARAERRRADAQKRVLRLRARLHETSDKLRKAIQEDDKGGMRRYETRLAGHQREVERAEAVLTAATKAVDRLVIRAPGAGKFTPDEKLGKRLKKQQIVGAVKE